MHNVALAAATIVGLTAGTFAVQAFREKDWRKAFNTSWDMAFGVIVSMFILSF